MNKEDLSDLRAEFDKFVQESCPSGEMQQRDPDAGDKEDDEPVPQFVDALTAKLLAPALSGVYLSRLDIKRIAEAIDESLPIKERIKMVRSLFRHTNSKEYLKGAFDEISKHINGRVLIYQELSEAFPASKPIFDEHASKAKKTMKMFEQIIDDFEEIGPSDDPIFI
ncbi:MAG: hypothetical protein A3E21_05760 [Sulfurimonas sp. RIFCSPHIGHO2_12_FULL_36_9]|uniref:hypothetical protein n=1 Tax=Sulfurimonas sp. RIFCSPLOWO2_12_36_12 TaxID=1802253 RepID=UPI0008C17A7A|nr:hypothetical protein [Sulfurimonas sp. RIFCSPLOWO2_12_36_12]OHD97305.1 MAG: hypothetical protein A3E21_05760 [Sulfurimonas sp. RIFCSPHIGHO2_12_FULL_36_9]OHD98845.1 MAG: hypothetical protein A3J26_00720 [Sulfurimonas sp. RIFCSPLOWO2_02_FULL_36_28]OHE00480.1 MAG: hypothetical protein A2W82_04170 [Sulfurimonas sp. RIFCSPLOWO2_12_36_12]OHE06979.1 MAG: hypothetical protein A3K14_00625 [Sulfurimonas sp. RIFCSPLOWO2_12_FULL_36_74]